MTTNITPNEPTRSLFTTKTAVAQYIVAAAGLASLFYPAAQQFVSDHSAAILFVIPLVNMAIRLVTHGRVQLVADSNGM